MQSQVQIKPLTIWIALLLFALCISACGTSNQPTGSAEEAPTGEAESTSNVNRARDGGAESAAISPASTRVYEHMSGSSKIPVKAERVVTDWYYGQLVALGIKPIGTDPFVLNNHPFIEQEGTESIGQSVEKILELEPDLILSWGANKYDDYAKIAPTVPLELNGGPKEAVQIFGDILGREEEAKQWISEFDRTVEEARQQISDVIASGETFTILNIWKNTLRVYGFVNMGGYALYEGLQVKAPAKVEEVFRNTEEWYEEISLEVISEYAGDHLIVTSYDPEGTSAVMQELEQSAVWSSLDAVKNNRVYTVDYNSLYFDDPIAIQEQVKLLAKVIAERKQY